MIDRKALTAAIVELEERRLNLDCISDRCDHPDGECPEPRDIGCGDAEELATEYERIVSEDRLEKLKAGPERLASWSWDKRT